MKLFRKLLFTLILPFSLWSSTVNAQYETLSSQGLLDELAIILDLARETETAINANLVIKQNHDREKIPLDREKANYDRDVNAYNADIRRFNAEIERHETECNRQLSVDELNACEEWEDELAPEKSALDRRLEQLNESKAAYNQNVAQWNQKEAKRAAEAQQLLAQYDEVDVNTKLLIARLNSQDVFRENNRSCTNSPSPEAMHQCFLRILNSSR
jgi:peptidoglycan hydrolase CwlO-like protein